ncbi:hypothetical protein T265_10040 [Opisthorchis viverrini]|uniref:Immunoglobulin domain protein n=1 Tax=Opisthorchis viverrini TaxID=6198 RepID=A0A074ZEQ2_OPIVI|nr:hypothetical protein T265_10040 [Opisthorchis viverrini]KER21695.1 hypothetical protein T265_10040 [Opisthorchis viverrini]
MGPILGLQCQLCLLSDVILRRVLTNVNQNEAVFSQSWKPSYILLSREEHPGQMVPGNAPKKITAGIRCYSMRHGGVLFWICILIVQESRTKMLYIEGTDSSKRIFVQSGENLALTCVYTGFFTSGIDFEWFIPSLPNEPVTSNAKTNVYWQDEINKKKFVLLVRSISTDDSGRYTCRMGRQDGDRFLEMARAETEVTVERSIITTDCPNEQWIPSRSGNRTTPFQESVLIRCVIQALPPPLIHWRFRGKELSTGPHYTTSVSGLRIYGPTEADGGLYTVIARQPKHTAVFDIQVRVFSRPRISHGPVILGPYKDAVVSDREAYLQCLASGYPTPTVHWYRSNDPQTELQRLDPHKYFVNTNSQVGTLRIARAQYPDDSDTYICRAMVSVPAMYERWSNDVIDEARLKVNVTLSPRLIRLTTMDRFVDKGDTVTVQCKVRATDPLKLYYEKFGSNRSFAPGVQPNDPRIKVWMEIDQEDQLNHNLYLTIQNTTHEDTWNYTCHAHNAGDSRFWNTTIRVVERPQMIPAIGLPSTDERGLLRFGWRHNATNLSCSSFGMPHPTWTWYRRGEQILNAVNSTFTIISWDHWNWSQSWLQVRPCRHTEHFIYDEYVCKATNIRGTNESAIRFERASVPGQPTLRGYIVTQSTLELFVDEPKNTGGLPVTAYELLYSAFGGPGRWYGPVLFPLDASLDSGSPRFRLHGLVAGTGYQLKLSARSIVGSGTPLGFFVQTSESTQPGPVELIQRTYATDPYSHVIQWKTPLNGGLPLTGYRIRLRPVRLNQNSARSELNPHRTVVGSGPWCEITPEFNNPYLNYYHFTNLDPDQLYQIIVEAVNERGRSLDGVNTDDFGYLNRTPSKRPVVYSFIDSIDQAPFPHDLVPIWSLFRTPVGDELGRPPRVFGRGPVLYIALFIPSVCCFSSLINYLIFF